MENIVFIICISYHFHTLLSLSQKYKLGQKFASLPLLRGGREVKFENFVGKPKSPATMIYS